MASILEVGPGGTKHFNTFEAAPENEHDGPAQAAQAAQAAHAAQTNGEAIKVITFLSPFSFCFMGLMDTLYCSHLKSSTSCEIISWLFHFYICYTVLLPHAIPLLTEIDACIPFSSHDSSLCNTRFNASWIGHVNCG